MSVTDLDRRTIGDALHVMAGASDMRVRTYAAGRVHVNLHAREAYSYGAHFPLFRFVPRGRRRPLIVLNGDTWGGSRTRTPDHQAAARELASELGDTCVIPFSALDGAGLEIDSIRPIDVRSDATWQETVRVERFEDVPRWRRTLQVRVERSAGAIADVPEGLRKTWRYANGTMEYREIERGPDGLFHWTESETRDRAPDADGSYSWTEARHRLGDCLFSAVRAESYLRPARPFETDSESARRTIEVAWRESHCPMAPESSDAGWGRHVTGPSGACIHCGRELQTRVTVRRRATYLSSFDYQERAPLYFLAEIPRGAGARTVDEAIDALAPRAVHAARARDIPVVRQGDVFFIRTSLTLQDLESRGIVTRARLTQWTRDARARAGETGYIRPLDARGRARMARYRRAEWRRVFRAAHVSACVRGGPPAPGKDSRARWAKIRATHALELERARAELRASVFGLSGRHRAYPYWNESRIGAYRRACAERARRARERLTLLESRGPQDSNGNRSAAAARDSYRSQFRAGPPAKVAWSMAGATARARFMPHEWHGPTIERRRTRVRSAVSIYGTAHSASEVVRTRAGAIYVRGTVRHVPDLEPGRDGAGDHRPVDLGQDGAYWLAVRNTVPRQRARRA